MQSYRHTCVGVSQGGLSGRCAWVDEREQGWGLCACMGVLADRATFQLCITYNYMCGCPMTMHLE